MTSLGTAHDAYLAERRQEAETRARANGQRLALRQLVAERAQRAEVERQRQEAEQAELARLEAENVALQARAVEAAKAERALKFHDAGVDVSGAGKVLVGAFDGDADDPDAIRQAAVEAGMQLTGGEGGLAYRWPAEEPTHPRQTPDEIRVDRLMRVDA